MSCRARCRFLNLKRKIETDREVYDWALRIAELKAPASYYLCRETAPQQLKLAIDLYFDTLNEESPAR